VLRADLVEDALIASLQHGPETLNAVGVGVVTGSAVAVSLFHHRRKS